MVSCLVTGTTGLIGSHLVKELSKNNIVYAISRRAHSDLSNYARLIQIDLSKPLQRELLPPQMDVVIHLAQSEHFRDFPKNVEDVFSVNTVTTLQLLNYARLSQAKTFIYASSGGVYGYGDEGFNENEPIITNRPLGFYLSTKLCSEIIAENYSPYFSVILLRFFFVYGPGQRETMLVPRLINSVKNSNPIQLQGENGIRINPTYVDDAVQAIINATQLKDSQKINVGGPEVLSMREIGVIIGEETGITPRFDIQQNAEPRNLIGDIKKMSTLLEPPHVTFREGIRSILTHG